MPSAIKVNLYASDGSLVKTYASATRAAAAIGADPCSVAHACRIEHTVKGHKVRYVKEGQPTAAEEEPTPKHTYAHGAKNSSAKRVFKIDSNNKVVATFDTVRDARKDAGLTKHSFLLAMRGGRPVNGFCWKAEPSKIMLNNNAVIQPIEITPMPGFITPKPESPFKAMVTEYAKQRTEIKKVLDLKPEPVKPTAPSQVMQQLKLINELFHEDAQLLSAAIQSLLNKSGQFA